jgi:hypothetical protein
VDVKLFRTLSGAWIAALLVACGGGSADQPQGASADQPVAATSADAGSDLIRGQAKGVYSPLYGVPAQGADAAAMKQRLATRFNGRFAQEPEKLMGQRERYAGTRSVGPQLKAYGGAPSSVHRFLNVRNGSHFYTMSSEEKTSIEQGLPHYRYEGEGFFALTAPDAPLSPVFRFYSIYTGTHFYTIDPEERDFVRQYYWEYFTYEGVSWYATVFPGPGWVPMHRFFNNAAGTHFYTTSEAERLNVIATAPYMEYEGIGYYVRASGTALPVSPIASGNGGRSCISPDGAYETRPCETAEQMPPAGHVDGNRAIPDDVTRFDAVAGQPEADCRRDRVTGLVWEVKSPASGSPRSVSRRFWHLDRTDRPQVVVKSLDVDLSVSPPAMRTVHVPRAPTQAEVDSEHSSRSYVNYVNSIRLCGYSDWRIPTASELLSVVSLQRESFSLPGASTGPYISADAATWDYDETYASGNVQRHRVDGVALVGADALTGSYSYINPYGRRYLLDYAFRAVEESGYISQFGPHAHLMLVRGAAVPTSSRFEAVSIPYGRDAANNVLIDHWSKLQWRRCAEGQSWTGTSCTGTALSLNLYDALARAASLPGWRVPGIKELDTLYLRDADSSKVQADTSHFPMAGFAPGVLPFWSMSIHWREIADPDTPKRGLPGFQASFEGTPAGSTPTANVRLVSRYQTGYVRLVRVHP